MESENHTSRFYGILPMIICTSASNERSSRVVNWEIRYSPVLINAALLVPMYNDIWLRDVPFDTRGGGGGMVFYRGFLNEDVSFVSVAQRCDFFFLSPKKLNNSFFIQGRFYL